jgi:predicted transcriptional regulator
MVMQQLVSTKIPADWVDRLDKLVASTKLSRSALVKVAIGQYLGLSEVDPAVMAVDLRSQLDDIRARLEALERSTPSTRSSTPSTNTSTPSTKVSTPSTDVSTSSTKLSTDVSTPSTDVSTKPIATITKSSPKGHRPNGRFQESKEPIAVTTSPAKLMTVGELYLALVELGYSKKQGTFAKIVTHSAKTQQQLPADLIALNVIIHPEIRRSGSPNNNRLRWLSIDRP